LQKNISKGVWQNLAISKLVKLNVEFFADRFELATFRFVQKVW